MEKGCAGRTTVLTRRLLIDFVFCDCPLLVDLSGHRECLFRVERAIPTMFQQ